MCIWTNVFEEEKSMYSFNSETSTFIFLRNFFVLFASSFVSNCRKIKWIQIEQTQSRTHSLQLAYKIKCWKKCVAVWYQNSLWKIRQRNAQKEITAFFLRKYSSVRSAIYAEIIQIQFSQHREMRDVLLLLSIPFTKRMFNRCSSSRVDTHISKWTKKNGRMQQKHEQR